MGGELLDVYRRHWPRIGAVIALALGGLTALEGGRLAKTRSPRQTRRPLAKHPPVAAAT